MTEACAGHSITANPSRRLQLRCTSKGATMARLSIIPAYSPLFRGGTYIAARRCRAEGEADIYGRKGGGEGGGPHVRSFNALSGRGARPVFMASTHVRRVGASRSGDVNGDGRWKSRGRWTRHGFQLKMVPVWLDHRVSTLSPYTGYWKAPLLQGSPVSSLIQGPQHDNECFRRQPHRRHLETSPILRVTLARQDKRRLRKPNSGSNCTIDAPRPRLPAAVVMVRARRSQPGCNANRRPLDSCLSG